jgi:hypothetical protein
MRAPRFGNRGVFASLIAARLNGSYRHTPFFAVESGTPVVAPRVLTQAERGRVTSAA